MKIKMENGQLVVAELTNMQFEVIKSWGIMRWNRQRQWMEGPVSAELLNNMTRIVRLPEYIEKERQHLNDVQEAVDAQRLCEHPEPLRRYPVKLDMYEHQIRGCNMAMIALGLIEPETAQKNKEVKK